MKLLILAVISSLVFLVDSGLPVEPVMLSAEAPIEEPGGLTDAEIDELIREFLK